MSPLEQLQKELTGLIETSIDVRFNFQQVDPGADPVTVHNAMVKAQTLLSALENYLSSAIRAKASAERRVAKFRMAHQEKWDRAIVATNKRPTLSEYATGKEKAAEANLATLEEARTLRREEELLSFANEAVDIIRLHYYGLDKIRQDLRKRLDFAQTDLFNG